MVFCKAAGNPLQHGFLQGSWQSRAELQIKEDIMRGCQKQLNFSAQGIALQAGSSWDFDGDYYTTTDSQVLIPPSLK
eukprot:4695591-Karenia_brevis.AAC.1